MHEFSLHHKTVAPAAGFTPKAGDLVSAKFSDGQWYRAKVRRASPVKKEAELTFIDYGNQDTVAFSNIRPLDARFRSLPGQAHDARLRCSIVTRVHLYCSWADALWIASLSLSAQRANITPTPLTALGNYAKAGNSSRTQILRKARSVTCVSWTSRSTVAIPSPPLTLTFCARASPLSTARAASTCTRTRRCSSGCRTLFRRRRRAATASSSMATVL